MVSAMSSRWRTITSIVRPVIPILSSRLQGCELVAYGGYSTAQATRRSATPGLVIQRI